jgi:uncharacterized membrane protein YedE/YeeE
LTQIKAANLIAHNICARMNIFASRALGVSAGGVPMPSIYDRAWSPYAAGILIGLLQVPAFLIIATALGASSSYVTVGGLIASVFDPSVTQIDYVAKHIAPTAKNWWQVALVGGIAVGAFISMKLSGAVRQPISPIWARALGSSSPAKRYLVAFVAGFLMLLGARIADGCTSGHGLSGVAQLAVASMVAVTAMFAGGIATAMLLLRRI